LCHHVSGETSPFDEFRVAHLAVYQ